MSHKLSKQEKIIAEINNDIKEKEKIIKDNKESIININNKMAEIEKGINNNLKKLDNIDNKKNELKNNILNDKLILQSDNLDENEKNQEGGKKASLPNNLFKNNQNNENENIKKDNLNENNENEKREYFKFSPIIILDNQSNILKLGLSNNNNQIYKIPSLIGFSYYEYDDEILE